MTNDGRRAGVHLSIPSALSLWLTCLAPTGALAQDLSADARTRATEQQMRDGERSGLIHSLMINRDASTTQIYTHDLNRGPSAVPSPLDARLGG